MTKSSYFLLNKNIKKIVNEFYKEYPFLDPRYEMDMDFFYEKEIEKIKRKYTKEQREFILKQLKEQANINSNWYNRQLSTFAVLAAILAAILAIVIDFHWIFKIIGALAIAVIIIDILIIDKRYVKGNNQILRIISILEYIKDFENE